MPVADVARWWLDNVAAHRVRDTSLIRYRKRVDRIAAGRLGSIPIGGLRVEHVAEWVTELTGELAPKTIADLLTVLRQVLDQAVELGYIPANVATKVPNPKGATRPKRALTPDEVRTLLAAAQNDDRYGAALYLLFTAGWRVSEVLGLAWTDLDLDTGTAHVQRAAVYLEGQGMVLGPTKTTGATGTHHLAPGTITMLRQRQTTQNSERRHAGTLWHTYHHNGIDIPVIFTQPDGQLLTRQGVAKAIRRTALTAGLEPTHLSTHTGRRSVITALYNSDGTDLADIARHVGHANTTTTAGYVTNLGNRPQRTAHTAAQLLDHPPNT